MSREQQSGSPLILIVIIAAVVYFATRGSSTPPLPDPVTPEPKPDPAFVQPTEADVWEALAVSVERKSIGGQLQQHTDHLLKVVEVLKESGQIKDDSRASDWRAKREEITDANRSQIAARLRGKP